MKVPMISTLAICGIIGAVSMMNNHTEMVTNESAAYVALAENVTREVEIEEDVVTYMAPAQSEYVSPIDFETLKSENSDVCAWINIDGTAIDYPVMNDGTDSYLEKDFYGNESASGSIYEDPYTQVSSLNILYGHHMKNGSMFAAVDDFTDESFYNEHQSATIYYEDREVELEPMVVIVGKADSDLRMIDSVEALQDFASDKTIAQGEIRDYENIWILVTCNYWNSNNRTYLVLTEKDL